MIAIIMLTIGGLIILIPLTKLHMFFMYELPSKVNFTQLMIFWLGSLSYWILIIYLLTERYINGTVFSLLIVLDTVALFFLKAYIERNSRK